MSVYKEHLKLQSHGGTPSYINVTQQVRAAIENSGIKEGICVVISPHTTCGVFFEEFVHDVTPEGDEFLQADLTIRTPVSSGIPAPNISRRCAPGRTRRHICRMTI